MPKLDFSSLKTADLRSVAPVDESAVPRAPAQPQAPDVFANPVLQEAPAPAQVAAQPIFQQAQAPAPAPVQSATIAQRHAAASKKISLTSLKAGGPSSLAQVPAPAPVQIQAQPIFQPAIQPAAPAYVPAQFTASTSIRIQSQPVPAETPVPVKSALISLGTGHPVASVSSGNAQAEAPVAQESAIAEEETPQPPAYIEGVDIIQAAKVIGTEGQALANEILSAALADPEEEKRKAEAAALEAVVIPESAKEFFPNLEMDDDFFKDPLFEGIVPEKPEKKPEVRQPVEPVVAAEPVAIETATSETAEETPAVAEIPEGTVAENADGASVEIPAAETSEPVAIETATSETAAVETSEEAPAVAEIPEGTVAEGSSPTVSAETEQAHVEEVAKDLSAERKGGLSKLFGERKVLVRGLTGFLALVVIGAGAFSFMHSPVKVSGPEAVTDHSGSVTVPPIQNAFVPNGETRIISDNVRVFTGRRPNLQKKKANQVKQAPSAPQAPSLSGSAGPDTLPPQPVVANTGTPLSAPSAKPPVQNGK